jgi:hypothetical protein
MTFMGSLMNNPSGSIASQPGTPPDPLDLVNKIKDREANDFKNKANFMAELSLKQDRQRRLYGLDSPPSNQQQAPQQDQAGALDTAMNRMDPAIAPGAMQKAQLGIQQQQANTAADRVKQQGQLGQQAQDVKTKQEQLNQQKSDQIRDQKQNELQAKIDEAGGKLTQAQAALQAKTQAGQDAIAEHEKLAGAVEARHKAEMDLMQHKFDTLKDQHQQVIDNAKAAKNAPKVTTTSVNPEGTSRTTSTRQGSSATNVIKTNSDNTLHVSGGPKTKDNPSGEYDIPPDKLDHWNSLYSGDQSQQQQQQQSDQSDSPGDGD